MQFIGALIHSDFFIGDNTRDIILHTRTGKLHRISELHAAYFPLQYPLMFPYGEDGFRLGINIGFVDLGGRKKKNVTMCEIFAYRIQTRGTMSLWSFLCLEVYFFGRYIHDD